MRTPAHDGGVDTYRQTRPLDMVTVVGLDDEGMQNSVERKLEKRKSKTSPMICDSMGLRPERRWVKFSEPLVSMQLKWVWVGGYLQQLFGPQDNLESRDRVGKQSLGQRPITYSTIPLQVTHAMGFREHDSFWKILRIVLRKGLNRAAEGVSASTCTYTSVSGPISLASPLIRR